MMNLMHIKCPSCTNCQAVKQRCVMLTPGDPCHRCANAKPPLKCVQRVSTQGQRNDIVSYPALALNCIMEAKAAQVVRVDESTPPDRQPYHDSGDKKCCD